ncbi:hypothetical protein K0T92_03750 [Paenibacillus oenotherae]|uniref:Uncharacterized protein n=1 Tax=Paenibacillus oenotherae TaxID=1435645 RepID=A0ABS7D1R9_9BACL|nr:hypothetical protein [Paenibacillus oenotherae]MBW7473857.1 hypothetical protein [Paenibacillus oenotherae]
MAEGGNPAKAQAFRLKEAVADRMPAMMQEYMADRAAIGKTRRNACALAGIRPSAA